MININNPQGSYIVLSEEDHNVLQRLLALNYLKKSFRKVCCPFRPSLLLGADYTPLSKIFSLNKINDCSLLRKRLFVWCFYLTSEHQFPSTSKSYPCLFNSPNIFTIVWKIYGLLKTCDAIHNYNVT